MNDIERWIVRPKPLPDPAGHLVCVPFAGAGTGVYHGWAALLPPAVELWLLRPPGRETRLREEPYTDLIRLAEDAAKVVTSIATGPLVLFGHSLGAAIAFELARALRRMVGFAPAHLIVSGLPAPHLPRPAPIGGLPGDELLDALAERYQQVPAELRDDEEMRAMYLPVLRADLVMFEAYRFTDAEPLDCPITALGGLADTSCPMDTLTAWRRHTSAGFSLIRLDGGHFNLNTAAERAGMVGAITSALTRVGVS